MSLQINVRHADNTFSAVTYHGRDIETAKRLANVLVIDPLNSAVLISDQLDGGKILAHGPASEVLGGQS